MKYHRGSTLHNEQAKARGAGDKTTLAGSSAAMAIKDTLDSRFNNSFNMLNRDQNSSSAKKLGSQRIMNPLAAASSPNLEHSSVKKINH